MPFSVGNHRNTKALAIVYLLLTSQIHAQDGVTAANEAEENLGQFPALPGAVTTESPTVATTASPTAPPPVQATVAATTPAPLPLVTAEPYTDEEQTVPLTTAVSTVAPAVPTGAPVDYSIVMKSPKTDRGKAMAIGLGVGAGVAALAGLGAGLATSLGKKVPVAYVEAEAAVGDTTMTVSDLTPFKVGQMYDIGAQSDVPGEDQVREVVAITNAENQTEARKLLAGAGTITWNTPLVAAVHSGTSISVFTADNDNEQQTVAGPRSFSAKAAGNAGLQTAGFESTAPPFDSSSSASSDIWPAGEVSGMNGNAIGGFLVVLAVCFICCCGGLVLWLVAGRKGDVYPGDYDYPYDEDDGSPLMMPYGY